MFNFLDINECSSDPCGDHEDCEDGIGLYTCKCEKGYLNNGTTCQGNLITKGCLYRGQAVLLVGQALYQEGWISPRVYMGKTNPPTWAGSLSLVTRANKIYFPMKPGKTIFRN